MIKRITAMLCACVFSVTAFCHDSHLHNNPLREWTFKDNNNVKASFLMVKNDVVYLETENASVLKLSLPTFSEADQRFIDAKSQLIQQLNTQNYAYTEGVFGGFDFGKMALFVGLLMFFSLIAYYLARKNRLHYVAAFAIVGVLTTLFSFKNKALALLGTDPQVIDVAFKPFKPNVYTRWDANYFYCESKGIPTTHDMMKGITGWQQQFPVPQCYTGTNAWSITLNPVVAATPVPVNASHFTRGAIALAVNGIAIFNPFTNTGVDALVDGQLDNWGGHCGRADDYHYHTAPLHLYGTTTRTLPIAYALDGFAVYGGFEPTGVAMTALDANHGHYLSGVYHYHGTTAFPYMIGNMVGQVNEDATMQIIPQAQATPIRPAGTPLRGAVITNCVANGTNGYILTYTLSNLTYKVTYSWTALGVYTFKYNNPTDSTTSTYNGFRQCTLLSASNDVLVDSKSIVLYPNPTHHAFSLTLDPTIQASDIQNISILSTTGQVVFSSSVFQEKIKTTGFAKGLYFVLVKTKEKAFVKKLVVE